MLPAEETSPRTIESVSTAFLSKLWLIVNDPNTNDLIRWCQNGKSFMIIDQTRFSQELIPKYFKHNNMASFIRQLNMYGFRKVLSLQSGGLTIDKGEMEFSHPQFIRGQPTLIKHIKRKPQSTRPMNATSTALDNQNAASILSEVQKLRGNQEEMASKFMGIKKENELLWREYANIRQKFSKQQQIIEKLVQFLVAMVKSPGGQPITTKRKYTHLALEGAEDPSSSSNQIFNTDQDDPLDFDTANCMTVAGPVIHEVTHLPAEGQEQLLDQVFQSGQVSAPSSRGTNVQKIITLSNRPNLNATTTSQKQNMNMESANAPNFISDNISGYTVSNDQPIVAKSIQGPRITSPITPEQRVESLDPLESAVVDPLQIENVQCNRGQDALRLSTPNGTQLETESVSYYPDIDSDPELSSELLQTVNPSLVSPNIVLNVAPDRSSFNTGKMTSFNEVPPAPQRNSSSVGRKQGKNMVALKKALINASPAEKVALEGDRSTASIGKGVIPGHSGQSVVGRKGKGKSIVVPSNYESVGATVYEPEEQEISSLPSTDVAIPNKTVTEKEMMNHLDDVQTSLDSLQDIFDMGTVTVDPSAILSSLLGNEVFMKRFDKLIPNDSMTSEGPFRSQLFSANDVPNLSTEQETLSGNPSVSGNEVSLYNPSLYDMVGEDLDDQSFSSLLADRESLGNTSEGSPTKRPRLIIKKENEKPQFEDDSLSTPRPFA